MYYIQSHIIRCPIGSGVYEGESVIIPGMNLYTADDDIPFVLHGRQFPVNDFTYILKFSHMVSYTSYYRDVRNLMI
ncbi:MAG: hypothetical protein EZS28_010912 [Streblomastix strix]|uniref:Uncharacterized protein n=1 Tax=Streblomastix strix TaxID=222440 RepID=A0A5J4WEZ2_9EUKA|nr:MAG: hypothetical protein EZS28_010912 [Streblomastix strix]